MKHPVPQKAGNFLNTWRSISFWRHFVLGVEKTTV